MISLVIDIHQSKTHRLISLKCQRYLDRTDNIGKNIKILLIEDNPGDTCLIEDRLEGFANFSYELKNVGTLNDEDIGAYAIEKGAHDFFEKGQADGRLLECIIQYSI